MSLARKIARAILGGAGSGETVYRVKLLVSFT